VFILVIIRSYYSICVKNEAFKFSSSSYIHLPLDIQNILEELWLVAGFTIKQFCNEKKKYSR